jgi:excisionase family DNA binding protein
MKRNHERLWTVSEVANVFSCTVSCARRWIRERRIASIKIGPRLVRVPEREVDRLLTEGLRLVSPEMAKKRP